MNRRAFITLLGGAAAAWPLAARAQQSSPALIGFFNAGAAAVLKNEIDAFREGLRSLGHIEGRNIRFEYRFADGYLRPTSGPGRRTDPAQSECRRLLASASQSGDRQSHEHHSHRHGVGCRPRRLRLGASE